MEANPKSPIVGGSLDRITDPAVRDAFRTLMRNLENVYAGVSKVVNFNLARTVEATGPNPPVVADGESILWKRVGDVIAPEYYIVSRIGDKVAVYAAAQVVDAPAAPTPEPPPDDPGDPPPPPPPPDPDPDPGPAPVIPVLPVQGATIPTFHSMGLYWNIPATLPAGYTLPSDWQTRGFGVRYRMVGDTTSAWQRGFNLWYDGRSNGQQYAIRGSVVHLTPNVNYLFHFGLPGPNPNDEPVWVAQQTGQTWPQELPEDAAITVVGDINTPRTSMYTVLTSGTASAYKVYEADGYVDNVCGSGAIINVGTETLACIRVSASYVKIRGFRLVGGQTSIRIDPGVHHVVIEWNDMTGWCSSGNTMSGGPQSGMVRGDNSFGAIHHNTSNTVTNIVIQCNKIHEPAFGASTWDYGHPIGPNYITFYGTGGNHVIRYNEMYSDSYVDNGPSSSTHHMVQDGMGENNNFSTTGFPGPDCDIYANSIKHVTDDAIECEGGVRNVRVWGNYIDWSSVGVASTVVHFGPIYIWRNVCNRNRNRYDRAWESDSKNGFAKSATIMNGSSTTSVAWGHGRRYLFHNTLLQHPIPGSTSGGGIGECVNGLSPNSAGDWQPLSNTMTRNNIFHSWRSSYPCYRQGSGNGLRWDNDLNYNLYNGSISSVYSGAEAQGLNGVPTYKPGHGAENYDGGFYELADNSPGRNMGQVLYNFSDGYVGTAPDCGASESGALNTDGTPKRMYFGIEAWRRSVG